MAYLIKNPLKRKIVAFLDNIGKLVFDKRGESRSEIIKSILLIRLDHLGDVLLTTPAVRSIKQRFPHARVTMVVKGWSVEAIKNNPHIAYGKKPANNSSPFVFHLRNLILTENFQP